MRKTITLLALAVTLGYAPIAQADVCDLTSAGSTCGPVTYGAIYTNADPQPTGTGYIDPFLRLQGNSTEEGYNVSADWKPATNAQDFQFDQKNPSFDNDPDYAGPFKGYTRDLALSEVPIVTIDGVAYREFWLDINEPNSMHPAGDPAQYLSLDQLQIFLSPTAGLGVQGVSDYNTSTRQLNGLAAIYDLDSGGNNWIKMNYDLGNGSGSGDMVVYIPNSLFVGGSFVYLYSQFGSNFSSADGFEEWWVDKSKLDTSTSGSGAPEPSLLLLFGAGLVMAARRLRTRSSVKSQTL